MFQLDLFGETISTFPAAADPDRIFLIAHKCRGEPTYELAIRWNFGTKSDPSPWWILQSTGNRVYPYWIGGELHLAPPQPPPTIRDFYDPKAPPLPKRSPNAQRAPSLDDF